MLLTYGSILVSIVIFVFLHNLNKKKVNFGVRVLISMFMGITMGAIFKNNILIIEPIGKIFVSLIKMVVIPLIVTSLISSITSLESPQQLKKIGLKTLVLLLSTTGIAAAIGILVANVMNLGNGIQFAKDTSFQVKEIPAFSKILIDMIPKNPLASMVEGKIIPVIIFSLFVSVGIIIEDSKKTEAIKPIKDFINSFAQVMFSITKIIINLAPYGVFALMSATAAKNGIATLIPLVKVIVAMYIASVLHMILTYGSLLTFVAKVNPIKFFKKLYPAQVVAFTTQSSYGTLPVTLKTLTNRLMISDKIASFVAPIGTNVGMNGGGGIYPAIVAIFVANVFKIELSFSHYLLLVTTTVIGSIGIAGVPGAATIASTVVLSNLGLPIEGLAMVLGIDVIMDMVRTMINVTGASVAAFLVANSEDEFDRVKFNNDDKENYNLKLA
ncbi:dicarboxylate/amino acid:cation symporter [Oceanirhabdus sp. W0125-5]|uniref:dicarboxylate/amino acid:cation symporter n=1 Tax=Oceanirhabdus sp. W0125-5 TaxID=2999116 RepID=UPI0022F34902|nr:dicarboxylate/amino acid:cation symporter [Oceanirhabdus sp. W0125-5]WBW95052.1 dicarboxylate/amino acid:cation symporter [Oceanirhabdus sp. W0125-5]